MVPYREARIMFCSSGLLSMSPFEEGLSSNHFIAPFYGIFDLSKGEDSAIYFESRRKLCIYSLFLVSCSPIYRISLANAKI